MAARGIFSLISLILVAGGVLLMFFILLAGAIDAAPMNRWYLLQADTSNIPGAPAVSRWTYWGVCSVNGDLNACTSVDPAYPLDPPNGRNFGTTEGVPAQFIDTRFYFLTSRFMFSFMLIGLFFAVCAVFTGVLALCTRLGSYLSSLLTMTAMVFQAAQAALMTVCYVKGRDNFTSNGQAANISTYAFGFEWAAFACFFLSTIFFCVGGGRRKKEPATNVTGTPRTGFFGPGPERTASKKSERSRGSFIDKEYA